MANLNGDDEWQVRNIEKINAFFRLMSFEALAHTFHNQLNYPKIKLFEVEGNSDRDRDSGPSFKVPAFLSRYV